MVSLCRRLITPTTTKSHRYPDDHDRQMTSECGSTVSVRRRLRPQRGVYVTFSQQADAQLKNWGRNSARHVHNMQTRQSANTPQCKHARVQTAEPAWPKLSHRSCLLVDSLNSWCIAQPKAKHVFLATWVAVSASGEDGGGAGEGLWPGVLTCEKSRSEISRTKMWEATDWMCF